MTALLLLPNGHRSTVDYKAGGSAEEVLRSLGCVTITCLRLALDDQQVGEVWMDVTDPLVNRHAGTAVLNLTGVHIVCVGPVIIDGIDDDMLGELAHG